MRSRSRQPEEAFQELKEMKESRRLDRPSDVVKARRTVPLQSMGMGAGFDE